MKINWGTAIVIVIASFMAFILYFVVSISTDKKYSHDLVSKQYYQKELKFQDDIDATKNAAVLKENVSIQKTKEGMKIIFPEKFTTQNTKGKVFLYRPSNKQLDFEIPISLTHQYLLVPEKRLLGGRWNITIAWKSEGKSYQYQEEIMY